MHSKNISNKKKRVRHNKSLKHSNKSVSLKVIYFNAKSAYSKKMSIQKIIDSTNPDIVAIAETWFKLWIPKIESYRMLRS